VKAGESVRIANDKSQLVFLEYIFIPFIFCENFLRGFISEKLFFEIKMFYYQYF
jgi:hypothetical protein